MALTHGAPAMCVNSSGLNDGGSGDDDLPSTGQAGSGGDNNMCPRQFPEHRSTSEGAASSVGGGGGGDMDQTSAGNTSTRWSNSSRYVLYQLQSHDTLHVNVVHTSSVHHI
jgi:hypothetical protein